MLKFDIKTKSLKPFKYKSNIGEDASSNTKRLRRIFTNGDYNIFVVGKDMNVSWDEETSEFISNKYKYFDPYPSCRQKWYEQDLKSNKDKDLYYHKVKRMW